MIIQYTDRISKKQKFTFQVFMRETYFENVVALAASFDSKMLDTNIQKNKKRFRT